MKDCVHNIPTNYIDDLYGILEFVNNNKIQESTSVYWCDKCKTHFFSSSNKLKAGIFSGKWENLHVNPVFETETVVLVKISGENKSRANYTISCAEKKEENTEVKDISPKISKVTEWYEKECNKQYIKSYSSNWILYGLQLTDGCYYIGRTQSFYKRMEEHFTGKGAYFTKKHKPYKILFVIDLNTMSEIIANEYENKKTIEFISVYGHKKVRGGDYCEENSKIRHEMSKFPIWTRECGINVRVRIKNNTKHRCRVCIEKYKLIETYIYYKKFDKNKYNAMQALFCPYCKTYFLTNRTYNDFPNKENLCIVNSNGKVITHKGELCIRLKDMNCGFMQSVNYTKECPGYCECPDFKSI